MSDLLNKIKLIKNLQDELIKEIEEEIETKFKKESEKEFEKESKKEFEKESEKELEKQLEFNFSNLSLKENLKENSKENLKENSKENLNKNIVKSPLQLFVEDVNFSKIKEFIEKTLSLLVGTDFLSSNYSYFTEISLKSIVLTIFSLDLFYKNVI